MNEKDLQNPIRKIKFKLHMELHQEIDEIDFDVVADCYNKLLELDGSSVRVTKEQCEEYHRKNPIIRAGE